MRLVSALSILGLAIFLFGMRSNPQGQILQFLALFLYALVSLLFVWAIWSTRSAALHVAFDPSPPSGLTRIGPYRFIRHPFYATYIIFWFACALATQHVIGVAFFLVIAVIYFLAAIGEERAFERTPYAAEYAAYRQGAGLFWPKFSLR